ncbi:MAG: hypothetical protein L7U70_04675 [Flavobacteriales bacterium]|nr:hypothetical protein [Flavobacteriales bacterium]
MFTFKKYLQEAAVTWKKLQHVDLTKDPSRSEMFLSKIKSGDEFSTTSGLVTIDKSEYDEFAKGFKTKGFSKEVKTSKGVLKYPGDFHKTPELGGKGKGSGVAAENAALKIAQSNLLKVLEKEKEPYITLKIGKRTIQCAQIISTPNPGGRDPKSDFAIVNLEGKMVAHISHKAGRDASGFQQYGGVTDLPNEKEIESFVRDVLKMSPKGLKSGDTYYRKLKSNAIANKSIYGVDYGKRAVTVNNVDEFHQGTMNFVKKGNKYIITSLHKGTSGTVPRNNAYEPILVARYNRRAGRYGKLNLPNSRIGIFPKAKVSRKAKEV